MRYEPKLGKPLTRKQEALLVLMADEGLGPHLMAERTGMAESTISTQLRRARIKLGAKSNAQAAVLFDRKRRDIY